jgi:hypothetical protein
VLNHQAFIHNHNQTRNRLGIKAGTEFEVSADKGVLILKPVPHAQLYVDTGHKNWGNEAFWVPETQRSANNGALA